MSAVLFSTPFANCNLASMYRHPGTGNPCTQKTSTTHTQVRISSRNQKTKYNMQIISKSVPVGTQRGHSQQLGINVLLYFHSFVLLRNQYSMQTFSPCLQTYKLQQANQHRWPCTVGPGHKEINKIKSKQKKKIKQGQAAVHTGERSCARSTSGRR